MARGRPHQRRRADYRVARTRRNVGHTAEAALLIANDAQLVEAIHPNHRSPINADGEIEDRSGLVQSHCGLFIPRSYLMSEINALSKFSVITISVVIATSIAIAAAAVVIGG